MDLTNLDEICHGDKKSAWDVQCKKKKTNSLPENERKLFFPQSCWRVHGKGVGFVMVGFRITSKDITNFNLAWGSEISLGCAV